MPRKKSAKRAAAATASPPPSPAKKAVDPLLVAALVLAFAVRLAYFLASRKGPFYEPLLLDPAYYHKWALRVAAGDFGGQGVFYGLPLYPFFLAFVYKLTGTSIAAVKLAQALLGVAGLFFVWKTAEKIASRQAAAAATFLGALYGPLFFQEGMFTPEALAVPFYSAAFYFACLFMEEPSVGKGVLTGLLLGLSALTKAGVFPFVAFFVTASAWSLARARKSLAPILAAATMFVATLAPVTLHNVIQGKDLVLLTSHAGFNFYIGNNPEAEGVFKAPEGTGANVDAQIADSRAIAEREMGRPLKASEVSKYWSGKARAWIRSNPVDFLRLSGRKVLLFFDGREISDVDDYWFGAKFNPVLRFPWPDFYWLGPLALLGFVLLMAGRGRHRGLAAAWVVGYLAGLVAFFINARYRLPLVGIFFPLAGLAAADAFAAARDRDWRRIGAYALILVSGAALTRSGLVETDWSRDYVNAGDVYLLKGDPDHALELYRSALDAKPDSSKANLAMGMALTRTGRNDAAKDYYLKAIQIEPANSLAYNNVGLWYEKNGDEEKAEEFFRKALELKPNSSQALNNLGMIYGKRGELEKALDYFERSLALDPRDAKTLTNSGLILYRMGRPEEAVRRWKEALQADPSFGEARKALAAVSAA